MAAVQNGHTNGINGHTNGVSAPRFTRFGDIPDVIDIPVRGEEGDEVVNLDLTELLDETDELCDLLENERAANNFWITIALAYVKDKKVDVAVDMIKKGLEAFRDGKVEDKLSLLTCLVWLQLWRSRHARRTKAELDTEDPRTKDTYLGEATQALNDAVRLSPSYPPLSLARGVLSLMRAASLSMLGQAIPRGQGDPKSHLATALKAFDEALRQSGGKNMMALMGKARAVYSMGRYADALALYQQVLEKAPDMTEPDPRIGLGCCLWALGHKEYAHVAWDRSLELNPSSTIAHTLLAMYYLDQAYRYPTRDQEFQTNYAKAMTDHVQRAFKMNDMQALTCATFAIFFSNRRKWESVEKLGKRAVDQTDVSAIASDGWYLRGRAHHEDGDYKAAAEDYTKADNARGGDEKGYLPAKFGQAQLRVLAGDYDGAKFRLEKILTQSKSIEAMTLLGILHAEDVFANQAAGNKEDKTSERKKAIGLLEQVRAAWRDTKRNLSPDVPVLLNLARLYESEAPEKSLACLLQVQDLDIEAIPEEERPEGIDDEAAEHKALRELVSPQLLNNIGSFHFHVEKYPQAREDFQTALQACVRMKEKDESIDTDSLVTTISYNLARTYEAEGMDDEAKNVYTSLLQRHPDYIDASLRLSYISLNSDPEAGAKMIKQLMEADPSNLEIRSLYGWHVNRTKRRTLALNEDAEQRHYKHTLMTYDKHDIYALTGMGNLHLAVAREMPRSNDQEKDKRSGIYKRAVEFFDKVLALDPRSAYAAQGLGIALADDRRDVTSAIQVFSKVRESIKDYSVHLNLGHIFVDVKQYGRSIENYDHALAKMKSNDPQRSVVLACLGRVWLLKGRAEKQDNRLEAMKTSLAYSRQALDAAKGAKDEITHRFNVAFVQFQIAQLITSLPEAQRTLAEVETASKDLDAAIEAFGEIAKAPNPPFKSNDIEQRASMGRNTMKRQLATAIEKQAEYERKNASRLEEARRLREAEIQRREDAKRAVREEEEAKRAKIAEERARLMEEDRALIQRRMMEDKAREEAEFTTDAETGERKKREKKPKGKGGKRKKKGGDDSDSDGLINDGTDAEDGAAEKPKKKKSKKKARASSAEAGSGSDGEGAAPRKKRRRLERKGASASKPSKYKSADFVQESDDDEDGAAAPAARDEDEELPMVEEDGDEQMSDAGEGEEESVARPAQRKKAARVLDDDEDEDEGEGEGENAPVGEAAATGEEDDG